MLLADLADIFSIAKSARSAKSIISFLVHRCYKSLLITGLQEGLKIRGCQYLCGGHNLPLLVEIGLTDLPKSGGAM
jgi:hypothetical protein